MERAPGSLASSSVPQAVAGVLLSKLSGAPPGFLQSRKSPTRNVGLFPSFSAPLLRFENITPATSNTVVHEVFCLIVYLHLDRLENQWADT
jgi:hypothetical protein